MRLLLPLIFSCGFACGGQLLVDYSDPDADLSQAQEGAAPDAPPLGHAGSACVGVDASFLEPIGPTCQTHDDCQQWEASYPSGLEAAFVESSECVANSCAGTLELNGFDTHLHCVSGGQGDAYCQAFAQQYVTHGKAVAKCVAYTDGNGHADPSVNICAFACLGKYGACGDEKHAFCIDMSGTLRCAVPCGNDSADIDPLH